MPLSRNIITKEDSETVAINYEPKAIDSVLSDQAIEYAQNKDSRGDFRVDKVVAEFVGIEELEKESQQREIAEQAIKLSKDVQENAYTEAYELGLKEGRESAYNEEKARIDAEMQQINTLIGEIKNIKTELIKENEQQVVNLCFYLAKRLLMKEVEANEDYVVTLIKKTLEMAQSDEDVTIKVSAEDKKWLDQHEETIFKDLNLDASTRIEEDMQIQRGGVVIETNHGVIDASVEQRLEKLETVLKVKT